MVLEVLEVVVLEVIVVNRRLQLLRQGAEGLATVAGGYHRGRNNNYTLDCILSYIDSIAYIHMFIYIYIFNVA